MDCPEIIHIWDYIILFFPSDPVITTNAPKPIRIQETAEGDYCIINSIFESTIKPVFSSGKSKPSWNDYKAYKITVRDAAETDIPILKSTHKTVNEYGNLKNLVENYMKKKDGQVMEGIWNFSNHIVDHIALDSRYS